MFVRLEQRRKPHRPWATIALVALCAAVFAALATVPPDTRGALLRNWGTVPASLFDSNLALLGLRVARLFTALFIHVGWLHLIGNLLFLLIFGLPAERSL